MQDSLHAVVFAIESCECRAGTSSGHAGGDPAVPCAEAWRDDARWNAGPGRARSGYPQSTFAWRRIDRPRPGSGGAYAGREETGWGRRQLSPSSWNLRPGWRAAAGAGDLFGWGLRWPAARSGSLFDAARSGRTGLQFSKRWSAGYADGPGGGRVGGVLACPGSRRGDREGHSAIWGLRPPRSSPA